MVRNILLLEIYRKPQRDWRLRQNQVLKLFYAMQGSLAFILTANRSHWRVLGKGMTVRFTLGVCYVIGLRALRDTLATQPDSTYSLGNLSYPLKLPNLQAPRPHLAHRSELGITKKKVALISLGEHRLYEIKEQTDRELAQISEECPGQTLRFS